MTQNKIEDNKRIARNTLLLYFRMMLIMGSSLYIARVLLNILGVEDYGVYNVVGGVVAMLSFVTNSLSAASSRFITFALGKGDFKNQQNVFANIQAIHLLFALTILLVAETIGLWFLNNYIQVPAGRESAAFWVFQFSTVTAALSIVTVPYNASIIANERMDAFAYISILDASLKLGIVLILGNVPFDKLTFYALLLCCAQAVIQFIYILYCKRHFKETLVLPRIDKEQFKEILSFAGWTMNGNLAVMGNTQGLNILLNMFFGPAVNAARAVAVQVQAAIQSFCVSFQMALNPQLTKSYAQGDFTHMHQLLIASSKFSFFLILFLSLPACLEAPVVLKWWLGVVPEHTVHFLRLIIWTSLIGALSNPIIISVHATGVIKKFQLIEGCTLLLTVPLAYIGLKVYPFAPEFVFVVLIIVEVVTQYVRLRIVLPMIQMKMRPYIMKVIIPLIKVTLTAPIIPLVAYYYSELNTINFFLICILSVICCSVSIYMLGCTDGEKLFVRSKVQTLLSKVKNR